MPEECSLWEEGASSIAAGLLLASINGGGGGGLEEGEATNEGWPSLFVPSPRSGWLGADAETEREEGEDEEEEE